MYFIFLLLCLFVGSLLGMYVIFAAGKEVDGWDKVDKDDIWDE